MAKACVCDEYFTVNSTGELCLKPGKMGLRGRVILDEVGVHQFRKADYPWLARVRVQVQGGGGGSAGATADAGELIARPGAPAGAWAERLIEISALGAVETVVVGGGGAGGLGNNAGGAGGTSSFGGFVMAAGGESGAANPPSGTAPVTARGPGGATTGTGDLVIGGGGSGIALRLDASNGFSGAGGDSQLGHGGNERRANGGGEPPTGYGAGAGGAFSINGSAQPGTAGGQGIVIIDLYG